MARGELVNIFINRIRCRDIPETQEKGHATAIHRSGEVRERVESLQLGAEQKGIVRPPIVEWLDPKPIANQRERMLLRIPQCEAEHPV